MTIRWGAIERAKEEVESLKSQYLRAHGWKETCSVPGGYWVWEREIRGKTYVMQSDLAASITRSMEILGEK